ncbi:hypothetical protein ONZ45_g11084 [Pleurotus djamor]|nr:hypothetical protein ONZ45_g11084 [Pleurotus djamor]
MQSFFAIFAIFAVITDIIVGVRALPALSISSQPGVYGPPSPTPSRTLSTSVSSIPSSWGGDYGIVPPIPTSQCPPSIPFYRAFQPAVANHFYTTNQGEMDFATTWHGYQREVDAGRIFASEASGTVPLYRLWNAAVNDHFYITDAMIKDNAIRQGYRDEGIAGYVLKSASCGSVPLHMLYSGAQKDHFYTTSEAEMIRARDLYKYVYEGVVGYVMPSQGQRRLRRLRLGTVQAP